MNLISNIIEGFKILFIDIPSYFYHLWFCKHDWKFESNIYGDQINMYGGRSWWKCNKCGIHKTKWILININK